MRMDRELLEIFALESDTAYQCIQVAPMRGGRAAILFLVSDPDFENTVSVVFVVDDFHPASAKRILLSDAWLMSLSATPSDELLALEATTRVWHFAGANWSRDKVSDISLRRIWAKDPNGPIAVGSKGVALRFQGAAWHPIPPAAPIQYFDVHGTPRHGLFACGNQGSLHRLTDAGWQPVELHRHDQFRGVDVAPDGTIRLAGDSGVCLRVAGEEATELKAPDHTFFAVRSFKGRAYWGDEVGVSVEAADALQPFEDTGIGSDLRSDGDYLYVAGIDAAWRFDGKAWKKLTLVYDNEFRLV